MLGLAMPGLCATPTPLPWPCMWPFGLFGVHIGQVQLWHPALLGGQNFEFLNDEVKEEKKIQKHKSLPKMSGGWELEVNGTEAKLLQKVAGEKITATLNIPNSILPTVDGKEEPKVGEPEPGLTSTLNFVVEVIKKGGKKTLVLTGLSLTRR
ncbi:complement component 1 Q subcomponent-binding protein, mitochondrial-like [Canis lupus dingo]|uniref:complement component 1 Q subcomponent-binding protein, mitochondrial-like n=1 Tax=Canis lupus dingo TaxID=286419 RepID=UPI0020C53B2F|nr:complement component 1 Q subcomponent-binding protein, mitochondrial-like [Canis lupus dingo]